MIVEEYKLLTSNNVNAFIDVVNYHLQNGWVLHGDLIIIMKASSVLYAREVVKVDHKDLNINKGSAHGRLPRIG